VERQHPEIIAVRDGPLLADVPGLPEDGAPAAKVHLHSPAIADPPKVLLGVAFDHAVHLDVREQAVFAARERAVRADGHDVRESGDCTRGDLSCEREPRRARVFLRAVLPHAGDDRRGTRSIPGAATTGACDTSNA
jgi:hypothetical protein